MNKFKILFSNGATYAESADVKLVTTPFAYGNKFDKRLDEAQVVILSSVEKYEPMQRVQIQVTLSDNSVQSFYYVIANDNAKRLYPASAIYEHTLFLSELTKELEGFLCQSITFTSTLSRFAYKVPQTPSTSAEVGNSLTGIHNYTFEYEGDLKTPLVYSSSTKLTPIIGQAILMNSVMIGFYAKVDPDFTDNSLEIIVDGSVRETTSSQIEELSIPEESFDARYTIWVEDGNGYYYAPVELVFHFDIVETVDPPMPYTIASVIDRILYLAEPVFGATRPRRYRLDTDQYDELKKIKAPDFTMTSCTLREQLQVVGGFIHAEPRLRADNTIYFESFNLGEECGITDESFMDEDLSWTINEYNTAIETNASNIVNTLERDESTMYEPNSAGTRTIRTDSSYTLISDAEGSHIQTILPIQEIYKVYCTVYNSFGTVQQADIDITEFVYEKGDYDRLSSYDNTYPNSKMYALYYTKGSKNINGLFFRREVLIDITDFNKYAICNILDKKGYTISSSTIADDYPFIAFRVEYMPIYSAMFSHSKQFIAPSQIGARRPFYKPYSQGENIIESSYYGENIKGAAQRMGNPERKVTFVFEDFSKIPAVGEMYHGYAISEVNVEILPLSITCSLMLTKDFNAISQYIGINSNKRVYEVSEKEAYARNILLREYCIVYPNHNGTSYLSIANDSSTLMADELPIKYTFKRSTSNTTEQGEVATLEKPISAVFAYRSKMDTVNDELSKVLLPVVSSGFGNVASFSWKYKDNYSAGSSVAPYKDEVTDNKKAIYQRDVAYGDYFGRLYWYKFELIDDITSTGGMSQAQTDAWDGLTGKARITTQKRDSLGQLVSTNPYLCMKDNREILCFNYQLEFLSAAEDLFIGSALASELTLVRGYQSGQTLVCYMLNKPLSKFDQKFLNTISNPNPNVLGTLTVEYYYNNDSDGQFEIRINTPLGYANNKYFCIATPASDETKEYDNNGYSQNLTTQKGGDILLWGKLRKDPNTNRMKFKFALKKTIYNQS